MKKIIVFCLVLCTVSAMFFGCSSKPKNLTDGTYTAIFSDARAEASHGWKDKLTINVSNGEAVIVEFDSYNVEDNRKKSEDESYDTGGISPIEFFPQLIKNWDSANGDPAKIEVVAGATNTSDSLKELMTAALKAAANGDTSEVVVE